MKNTVIILGILVAVLLLALVITNTPSAKRGGTYGPIYVTGRKKRAKDRAKLEKACKGHCNEAACKGIC